MSWTEQKKLLNQTKKYMNITNFLTNKDRQILFLLHSSLMPVFFFGQILAETRLYADLLCGTECFGANLCSGTKMLKINNSSLYELFTFYCREQKEKTLSIINQTKRLQCMELIKTTNFKENTKGYSEIYYMLIFLIATDREGY